MIVLKISFLLRLFRRLSNTNTLDWHILTTFVSKLKFPKTHWVSLGRRYGASNSHRSTLCSKVIVAELICWFRLRLIKLHIVWHRSSKLVLFLPPPSPYLFSARTWCKKRVKIKQIMKHRLSKDDACQITSRLLKKVFFYVWPWDAKFV